MDYPWYFPPKNNGGGGTVIVEESFNTETIPVTTSNLTASANITDISEETFGYSVEAFEIVNGVESPVFVSPEVTFSNNTAIFSISWQTAFNGYININYWEKK